MIDNDDESLSVQYKRDGKSARYVDANSNPNPNHNPNSNPNSIRTEVYLYF